MRGSESFACALNMNARRLVARSEAYETDLARRTSAVLPVDTIRPAPAWEPPPADIQDPVLLAEYLSPEVRRFAIALQTKLSSERDPGESAGLETLHKRLLGEASRLMEAVSHRSVTDRFLRPLEPNHPDHNPRRVLSVLTDAAAVACRALRIAQACGALENDHG